MEMLNIMYHNFLYSAMIALMTIWGAITIKNTDGLTLVEVERMYSKSISTRNNYEVGDSAAAPTPPEIHLTAFMHLSGISKPSSQDEPEDDSITGQIDQTSRMTQTPAEVADALSQAVDGLEISISENYADAAALDISHNNTKVSNMHNTTLRGTPGEASKAAQVSLQTQNANSQVGDESIRSQGSSFKASQSQGPFVCEKCQKTCRSRAGLKSHSRVHED